MQYKVDATSVNTCVIVLEPQSEMERQLLTITNEEDTFLFHYQAALQKHIDKDAVFLGIENSDYYPKRVVVSFKIAKGIGG